LLNLTKELLLIYELIFIIQYFFINYNKAYDLYNI
jgi:hypothetical protein